MNQIQNINFVERIEELEKQLSNFKSSSRNLSEFDEKKIDEILGELKTITSESKPEIIAPVFLNVLKSISVLLSK
jgi:hypothetical protein